MTDPDITPPAITPPDAMAADPMLPDPEQLAAIAGEFVARRFPQATDVVLAGSAARGDATPSSDIDLLIFGADTMFTDGSLAATYLDDGRLFEVFAYTEDAFDTWAAQGVAQVRPVILEMLFDGIDLAAPNGGVSGAADRRRLRWRETYELGPVVDQHALDLRRYAVTGWLDDTADARDAAEAAVSASALFHGLAELLLLTDREWIGSGKQLVRRLRAWNPGRAERLIVPFVSGDAQTLAAVARLELDGLGGPLRGGLIR